MGKIRTGLVFDNLRAKCSIATLLAVLGCVSTFAQVMITPSSPPVVYQGTTYRFTANVPVTWSCPGCAGTIDPDGTYHAPNSVKSNQSYGGYQLLPNDHIYNTRIDSLPVSVNSTAWIAGAGTVPLNYLPSFPVNYTNGSTPTGNVTFGNTPGSNGTYQLPAYPFARIESGWFANGNTLDRHFFMIDTTSGIFQELYSIWNCPSACESVGGVKYLNSTYALPANGSSDAAGLYVMPLTLRAQELEQAIATGGTIRHALRFTLQNQYICGSNNAGFCGQPGGVRHIWPATSEAFAGGGIIPYGARFRLKSSFNISSYSPAAQILLKQLQQYGIILSDGGWGWQITTEYTKWPFNAGGPLAAIYEVQNSNIAPSNFEAVDESGLEISASSGATTGSETVVATAISNPSIVARQRVVLTGVTLTLAKDALNMQANTPAQQLTAYVNGSANKGVAWSMNPAVGTLTAGGLYTPPTSVSAAVRTVVTATSNGDPSVAASMTVNILPTGTIRIILGQSSPYTDTHGNVWQPRVGDDGCFPYDNGGTWPSSSDIQLYKVACFSFDDDRFDISVPNGQYNIRGLFAETENIGVGNRLMYIESQGQVIDSNVDIQAAAGGNNLPVDFRVPATVTNGMLSYVLRHRTGDLVTISSLEIDPISLSGTPSSPSSPEPPPSVTIIQIK